MLGNKLELYILGPHDDLCQYPLHNLFSDCVYLQPILIPTLAVITSYLIAQGLPFGVRQTLIRFPCTSNVKQFTDDTSQCLFRCQKHPEGWRVEVGVGLEDHARHFNALD